ncbi:MAG: branched-chain amino acid ABC transporter permease, partial [Candidatus Thorarchaeota archaeon]
AIAMFIYNYFFENPDISGGETGLRIATPDVIRTAPFYLFFVALAFLFFAAFLGMTILYLKKRTETFGLILFTPVVLSVIGLLLIFGASILGIALVLISFLGMLIVYWNQRRRVITDPLQYTEMTKQTSNEEESRNLITSYFLPLGVVIIGVIGLAISFESNIAQMVALWIEQSSTFYFTIPVQYYLTLTCLVLAYAFIKRLIASPFGRMVTAVAQNEARAEALGYNSYRTKIVVLVISGAIAGLSGALYAPYIRIIDPATALGVGITIDAMLYTIIGGIGTLFGPILGAGVIVYSELNLVEFITEGLGLPGRLWLVVLGVIYVVIVLFLPLGIVGSIGRKTGALKQKFSRFKMGRFEFGLKDADYWVFILLGALGLFFFLMQDMWSSPLAIGIWILLGVICLQILRVYKGEIISRMRSLPSRLKTSITRIFQNRRR